MSQFIREDKVIIKDVPAEDIISKRNVDALKTIRESLNAVFIDCKITIPVLGPEHGYPGIVAVVDKDMKPLIEVRFLRNISFDRKREISKEYEIMNFVWTIISHTLYEPETGNIYYDDNTAHPEGEGIFYSFKNIDDFRKFVSHVLSITNELIVDKIDTFDSYSKTLVKSRNLLDPQTQVKPSRKVICIDE